MQSVGGVILAIAVLLVMVTIHEFGHYIAGKILGFKIQEFSVGFGPAVFKKTSKKTGELFAVRIVPLGGYCAFDGEEDIIETGIKKDEPSEKTQPETTENETTKSEAIKPKGKKFNEQPPWKRIIVLLAGVTMNYILGTVLIFIIFFCYGQPCTFLVGEKKEYSPDAPSSYDVVLSVNDKDIYLFSDYTKALDGCKKGDEVKLVLGQPDENGKITKRTIVWTLKDDATFENMTDTRTLFRALFGDDGENWDFASTVIDKGGFFEKIGHSFVYSFKIGGMVLRSLGELLTGKIPIRSMGGPVTTIKVTSQAVSYGALSFLNIAAFIGINLAVFNLLPIPALDGCKVWLCLYEWIFKKPVNKKVETVVDFIGILILFGFAILVDILQLFA